MRTLFLPIQWACHYVMCEEQSGSGRPGSRGIYQCRAGPGKQGKRLVKDTWQQELLFGGVQLAGFAGS